MSTEATDNRYFNILYLNLLTQHWLHNVFILAIKANFRANHLLRDINCIIYKRQVVLHCEAAAHLCVI